MLRIKQVEITNFACFDQITIEPSIDLNKPLTIIRAENGSGKTTLLRAIRWGMYGERGLPGATSRFSVHPANWVPDEQGIKTTVVILFETDGSTRFHPEGKPYPTTYELRRWVTTIAKTSEDEADPDFRRKKDDAILMEQKEDGSWEKYSPGVDAVVQQLLPFDLRDFFVMDADEAADFVGGSENKLISRQDVVDKTSFAVRALLGLEAFEAATSRLRKISADFGRDATKAAGDEELSEWQEELDRLTISVDQRKNTIRKHRRELRDIRGDLRNLKAYLETLLGKLGAFDELKMRWKHNEERYSQVVEERRATVEKLLAILTDIDLLASLASREISKARKDLQPLYDNGSIPVGHLVFVQHLVEQGTCVCGQDLAVGTQHRQRVEETVDKSRGSAERANTLSQVLQSANMLHRYTQSGEWVKTRAECEVRLATLDTELSDLLQEKRDIEAKLDEIDIEEVNIVRRRIRMLRTRVSHLERTIAADERELADEHKRVHELEGKIKEGRKRQREAITLGKCQDTADCLVAILEGAFSKLRNDQVIELGVEMDRLFGKMAANVDDDDVMEQNRPKATLRMIEEVGLQQLDDAAGDFEIFAKNSRGRCMPPTEINGASRRILALSFVLGLCKVSGTMAPLVADSMLNFLSGSVRTNTLRITATTASQPILLLTGSDLEAQNDVDLVRRYAGATYTLTGQWQHEAEGGDVVNLTAPRSVSLLCRCGPREFCSVCERRGQAGQLGWVQRMREESWG